MIDRMHQAMAPSEYAIQSLLAGLDAVAREMETKWGVGRLPLLVGDLMRAKWMAQQDKLNAAIASRLETEVKAMTEGTIRGWQALERAALDAGHLPRPVDEWEFVLPSTGEVCVLVRDAADVARVKADGRMVWSVDEIASIVDKLDATVLAVKASFAESQVRIKDKADINWEKGDEIPF